MRDGALEEAIRYFEIATHELPERRDILAALGDCYKKLKRYSYALRCFQQLEDEVENETKFHYIVTQADILSATRRYDEALELLTRAYAIAPNETTLRIKLGEINLQLGNPVEARRWYEQCGKNGDSHVAVLNGYGLALRALGELDKAHDRLSFANTLTPNNPDILTNLALILHDLGDYEEALAYFQRALTLDPNHPMATTYQAFTLLVQGKLGSGWDAYESRWQHPDMGVLSLQFEQWLGPSKPSQCLLIHSEQGVGDQIMFASCLADVRKYAGKVIIECNDKLESLFARAFPWANVVARSKFETAARWKKVSKQITQKVAIGSLPRFFRRNSDDFPLHQGYLVADARRVAKWRRKFQQQNRFTIGISWRGGLPGTRRYLRSLDLDKLGRLVSLPNFQFVNLQYDFTETELETFPASIREKLFTDFSVLSDLDETAAVISAVDLVVTVQTTVAHLSGALNHPTWVLLPALPEWRYRQAGSSIPWYPSVRLFRQTTFGDWTLVMDDLCREISNYSHRSK